MSPTPRRARRRALGCVVLLAAFFVLGFSARPADAHAILVSSSPGDGAVLERAPGEVVLEFNEPISADLGGLRVFDADGDRIDEGALRNVDTTLAIDLTSSVPDGAYVISYRVISADGHPVRGGIVFSVGESAGDKAGLSRFFSDEGDRPWEIAGGIARWLSMAGAMVVVGGVAFVTYARPPIDRRMHRLLGGGVVAAVVGMVSAVPVQAALATGRGAGALFEDGVLSSVLADGFGLAVALGVVGTAVAAAAFGRQTVAAVAGALAVVASFPLVGHTRFDDVAVGVVADVGHVGAAAVWTGGLVFLLLARSATDEAGDRVRLVGRFSNLATVSIVLVGVAGLALSWTEVRSLSALTSTTYGWTLLAKVALVGLVAAAGAFNHFRLLPRLADDPGDGAARARLTRSLRFEVAFVAIVLAATAVLVNLTPAYVDAGIGQLHSEILELGDAGSVQVVVDPNRAGENSVHLYFYDPAGSPAEIAEGVELALTKPGDDIGPIEREPFRAGPAHFQWDGPELVSSGRWEITVVARIDQFSEETATTDVLVG